MAPTKPTDFNRALGDAKKQAGDVADAFTDAAHDVYGQARESAADVAESATPSRLSPIPPWRSRSGSDGCWVECTGQFSISSRARVGIQVPIKNLLPDNQQANADQPINRHGPVQLRRDSVGPGSCRAVSIGRSVTFKAARARTVRSMSGKSPRAGDVLECAFECLLECLLEILRVVQSPYLLRHRNKAVMALANRDFMPGQKFARHPVTPARAG
jgi:hypothetical protein